MCGESPGQHPHEARGGVERWACWAGDVCAGRAGDDARAPREAVMLPKMRGNLDTPPRTKWRYRAADMDDV
ncbi:hypothetical protein AAHA92_22517 [Salvia divinorum]|uniref:Uncharacterized protein n=1 Tax=Salvia divinorum TaxID=28513 RepID=A0ABD1GRT5_SALDI